MVTSSEALVAVAATLLALLVALIIITLLRFVRTIRGTIRWNSFGNIFLVALISFIIYGLFVFAPHFVDGQLNPILKNQQQYLQEPSQAAKGYFKNI